MSYRTTRLEPLESRLLFNTFVVDGTPDNDLISIQVEKGVITVVVNGEDRIASDPATDVIDVRGLGGDDTITVLNSGDNDILLSGDAADGSGSGNDTIHIGTGNLDSVGAPVTVTGGGGNDVVHLNDQNNMFGDGFTITSGVATRFFFGGLTYSADLEQLILNASRGSSQINVNSTSATTHVSINSGLGSDTINVNETHPAVPVTVLPAPGEDAVNVNSDDAGSAHAVFSQTQRIGELTVGSGGRAVVGPASAAVLTATFLNITGTGEFDLADNHAIVDYPLVSPLSVIQPRITDGYNNGAWNGSGINSSVAATSANTGVGFAEATDLFTSFPATFAGQSIDNTSILLAHTLYGDADLNRTVNLADFNRLAANFGQAQRRWSHGDFDFTTSVNLADFNRLASNFGQNLPTLEREGLSEQAVSQSL